MIALPWKKLCANFILPCGENHYGFFLRCPTSFYNRPFNKFQKDYSKVQSLNYDICFNDWPLEPERYDTTEYKRWFQQLEEILGNQEILYSFWYDEHREECDEFVDKFVKAFNLLADREEMDSLPPQQPVEELDE